MPETFQISQSHCFTLANILEVSEKLKAGPTTRSVFTFQIRTRLSDSRSWQRLAIISMLAVRTFLILTGARHLIRQRQRHVVHLHMHPEREFKRAADLSKSCVISLFTSANSTTPSLCHNLSMSPASITRSTAMFKPVTYH